MATFSAAAPVSTVPSTGAVSSLESLLIAPVRQGLMSAWQFLEDVGAVRAAAELERRARSLDALDPARARVLHDAARRCLDRV